MSISISSQHAMLPTLNSIHSVNIKVRGLQAFKLWYRCFKLGTRQFLTTCMDLNSKVEIISRMPNIKGKFGIGSYFVSAQPTDSDI